MAETVKSFWTILQDKREQPKQTFRAASPLRILGFLAISGQIGYTFIIVHVKGAGHYGKYRRYLIAGNQSCFAFKKNERRGGKFLSKSMSGLPLDIWT